MPELRMRPSFMIATSVLVLLLVASLFGLTSLNIWFIRPGDSSEVLLLFALSTMIFLSLVIFGFILFRSLLKLYLERRANQLGSKFKTKLVCGAIGLSVLPVCFLFLFSYSLLNRTLDKWFSRPFETISRDAHEVVEELRALAQSKAASDAQRLSLRLQQTTTRWDAAGDALEQQLAAEPSGGEFDFVAVIGPQGQRLWTRALQSGIPDLASAFPAQRVSAERISSVLAEFGGSSYAMAQSPVKLRDGTGAVIIAKQLPSKISESAARLHEESVKYGELSQERKFLRRIYLSMLLLLTVLILFIATWFALFLSRQVTVPIQALAEATHEVSRGKLDYRIQIKASDELGTLVRSFNEMMQQLSVGRAALETSRSHLEQVNQELDQRRRFTETILESIPSAVISVSGNGTILGGNSAAGRLFGQDPRELGQISNLFSGEDLREIHYLLKRAARMGQATRSVEIKRGGRALHLAMTVTTLPGSATDQTESGRFVLVIEDMSDLLQAQKSAAWGEVAQRIAHEIKNPLTPIALSAERILLWLDRQNGQASASALQDVLRESCGLIHQEVGHLKRLVDEFSQFARFPNAQPVSADLNPILDSAISLFNGRLDGIGIRTRLAPDLPKVQVDPDQMRRVFVNLIDNAAEAMEHSLVKEITLITRTDSQREVIEAEVCDTGCGVTPEDKEKLFLPYFSTKDRGTGLGLAIVSRVISEHKGNIRVEENRPVGTRFILELPIPTA